jgi:hypothetical protein
MTQLIDDEQAKKLKLTVMPASLFDNPVAEQRARILWRRRRLRLAEAATVRRGPEGTFASYHRTVDGALGHLDAEDQSECVSTAVRATAADTDEDMADVAADETVTRRALELLASKRNDAYETALAALREDTQAWWADVLARDPDELGEEEQPATADVEGLRRFLEGQVLPWFENRRKELANRPLIREQAFGEALDPDKLERLGRYEVHLDRKLERMLAMLLCLKDLRRDETSQFRAIRIGHAVVSENSRRTPVSNGEEISQRTKRRRALRRC